MLLRSQLCAWAKFVEQVAGEIEPVRGTGHCNIEQVDRLVGIFGARRVLPSLPDDFARRFEVVEHGDLCLDAAISSAVEEHLVAPNADSDFDMRQPGYDGRMPSPESEQLLLGQAHRIPSCRYPFGMR